MSFLTDYFDIVSEDIEVAVCCPFPHYTENGLPYMETHPSAHVNTLDNLFHCKACGASGSELTMIQRLLGCNYASAKKIQKCFNTVETIDEWSMEKITDATKNRALNLGISEEVIQELNIKTPEFTEDIIAFPVFMYGHLMDVRQYNPGGEPKIKSRSNCPTGLIIPYDIWRETPKHRMTLICAGEKDMAIARTQGFNAITLTGGETVLPCQLNDFKDRHIAICYDNDETGRKGAIKLANELLKVCKSYHKLSDHTQRKRRYN